MSHRYGCTRSHPARSDTPTSSSARTANRRRLIAIPIVADPCRARRAVPAGQHRAHIVHDPRQRNHEDVGEREPDEDECREKVKGAGRLSSTQQGHDEGHDGVEARRHREPGENAEGTQPEDHPRVGDLLQHVVVGRRLACRMAEPQVIADRVAEAAEVARPGQKIVREVMTRERVDGKAEAGEDENPGEQEMPATSHGQPLAARESRPAREASLAEAFSVARRAEDAGRLELETEYLREPLELAARRVNGLERENGAIGVGSLAPIEGGVGVEDLKTAERQDQQAKDDDPVCDPSRERMPVHRAEPGRIAPYDDRLEDSRAYRRLIHLPHRTSSVKFCRGREHTGAAGRYPFYVGPSDRPRFAMRASASLKCFRTSGFSMISVTPRRRASAISPSVARPVMMMTGRLGSVSLMRRSTATPFRAGNRMSRTTASGRSRERNARPSSPVYLMVVSWPSMTKASARTKATRTSSSIKRSFMGPLPPVPEPTPIIAGATWIFQRDKQGARMAYSDGVDNLMSTRVFRNGAFLNGEKLEDA